MVETAEMRNHMEKLYTTLKTYVLIETPFIVFIAKILPWRSYTDYSSVLETWEVLWENPERYAEGELTEEFPDTPESEVFRQGVAFGIEYETAYPSGERDEWPVPIEER